MYLHTTPLNTQLNINTFFCDLHSLPLLIMHNYVFYFPFSKSDKKSDPAKIIHLAFRYLELKPKMFGQVDNFFTYVKNGDTFLTYALTYVYKWQMGSNVDMSCEKA